MHATGRGCRTCVNIAVLGQFRGKFRPKSLREKRTLTTRLPTQLDTAVMTVVRSSNPFFLEVVTEEQSGKKKGNVLADVYTSTCQRPDTKTTKQFSRILKMLGANNQIMTRPTLSPKTYTHTLVSLCPYEN